MGRSLDDWADRLQDRPVKTVAQIVALLFVAGLVITVALWLFGVVAAPWAGGGNAYQQKNSAQNWVAAQRQFHQDRNDVTVDVQKIASAKTVLAQWKAVNPAPTGDLIAYQQWSQQEANYQTAITGPQQACLNTVSSYNTDAESYLTEDWRDTNLPDRLDPSQCS